MANKFDNNANKIAGTTNSDNFNGLGGNDSISGMGGDDILNGGLGDDLLNGGVGNDTLIGDKGTDTLIGDSGNDSLSGGADNDNLDGGAQNDSLDGGVGADAMTGGDGDDLYWVDNVGDKITEKLGVTSDTDTVTSAVNYTLGANLENLTLKPGTTGLNGTGNELKNVITGNAGNNYLDGKGEDDQLIGGGGDDTLDGGAGKDKLTGGDGSDTYMVTNTDKDVIEETARDGDQDVVKSSVTYTLGNYLEVLTLTGTKVINGTGNELDNTITGNDAANILTGDAGDDVINAGAGDDMIDGGEGNDEIDGGDGHDTVVYQSDQANYDISTDDEGKWTVEYVGGESEEGLDTGVDEGTDTIINVETLSFADGDIEIMPDDPTPEPDTLSVKVNTESLSVNENAGTAKVMVSLSAAATEPVTVKYATSAGLPADMVSIDGAATSGIDYRNASGVLTFAVGETSKTISVAIRNDTAVELNENFTVTLSNPTNATLGSTIATVVTIIDNDVPPPPPTPTLQLDATTISTNEGAAAQITVDLSAAATQSVTVDYTTTNGTADAGDYTETNGSLTFAPGQTSQTITVATLDDAIVEGNENFTVQLSNPANATLGANAVVSVTIVDNDVPPPPPTPTLQLDATAISTTEGNSGQITVSLSETSTQVVMVDYTTTNGTADAGDYTETNGSLTFAPGETSQTITVSTLDDVFIEPNETFTVQLSNPASATLGMDTAVTVTIIDDTHPTPNDDYLVYTSNNDDVDALDGNDTVLGQAGNDTIAGNNGNDSLSGGDGNDQLLGGEGNDVLQDSNGDDSLSGGLGDDRFVVDGKGTGTVLIEDTGGNDTLDASGANEGVRINLNPGQTSTVNGQTITLSAGGTVTDPLDVYFLEDLTGSFGDDIKTVKTIMPEVITAIKSFQPDSTFGLGSFMDKPISPFGVAGRDYVYVNNLTMTIDQAAFSTALNTLVLGSGSDFQESQLEALMQVALRSDTIGFRNDAVKTVVLMTDASYHKAGDGMAARITTPNNGDDILDGKTAGTGEDYPTVEKVAEALKAAGILPIFAVTKENMAGYDTLVTQLGVGSVVELTSNSSNLVTVITSGIKELTVATVENAIGSTLADTIIGDANANVLTGGAGVDQLTGGAGSDTFLFRLGDSAVGAGERDIIEDFNVATANEVIDLSGLSIGALSFIGTAEFSAAGQVRYIQDTVANTTVVQINLEDVVSVPEMEIQLTGKMSLTASDFILV